MQDKEVILHLSSKGKLGESGKGMDEKHELDDSQRAPEPVTLRTGGWKTSPYILGT